MKINISLPQEISQYGKSPSFRASVIAKDSNNLINISNTIPVKTLYLVGCRIGVLLYKELQAPRFVLGFKDLCVSM